VEEGFTASARKAPRLAPGVGPTEEDAAGGAALAATAPVAPLWRFGWEAAQRHLRDDIAAHQCQTVLRGDLALSLDRGGGAVERSTRHRGRWCKTVFAAMLNAMGSTSRPLADQREGYGAADPAASGSPLEVRSERVSVDSVLTALGAGRPGKGSGRGAGAPAREYEALCKDPSLAGPEDVAAVLDAVAALPSAPLQRFDSTSDPASLRNRAYAVNFHNIIMEVQRATILKIVEVRSCMRPGGGGPPRGGGGGGGGRFNSIPRVCRSAMRRARRAWLTTCCW
jgi:hypothetical protein